MKSVQRKKILEFIKTYKDNEGIYPTMQQIQHHVGLKSVSTVHSHISKLIEDGEIRKSTEGSGFSLADSQTLHEVYIPVIGYITAGMPIEAVEVPTDLKVKVKRGNSASKLYALKVKGDSMVDENIFDGDVVVIKEQSDAYDGQAVVAVIDDNQATLKKLYREKNGYRLQPANQSMLPIFAKEVEVRGVVWDIVRSDQVNERQSGHGVNPTASNKDKVYKTIDLFAGVGGIRIGFEKSGRFKTVFANDFDKACKITYDLNFSSKPMVLEDVNNIDSKDLPDFDLLLGGFPCQAFSIAGYRKGFDDEKGRGNLFFKIEELLESRRPEAFLLENVKNLKTHDGGRTFSVIQDILENKLGYKIKSRVLNSMEYGNVPQNRERIYIVGFKDHDKADDFEFPDPIPLKKKVTDILDDEVDQKYYYNGKPLYERIKEDVNEVGQVYQWRRKYVRKNKKGVCPTLTANMGMGGHNVPIIYDGKGVRKLTPRECFRLQGFDDEYKLPNIADSALYKQAGNSVSVPVLERIASQMAKVL